MGFFHSQCGGFWTVKTLATRATAIRFLAAHVINNIHRMRMMRYADVAATAYRAVHIQTEREFGSMGSRACPRFEAYRELVDIEDEDE